MLPGSLTSKKAPEKEKNVPSLEGPAMDNFLNVLRSKETKGTYIHRMKQYLEYRRWKSADRMLKGTPEAIQKDVIDYLMHLKNKRNLSHASRRVTLAMFRKFYSQNDVVLNWDKVKNYLGAHERTIKDRAYTRDEIRRLLDVTDLRGRVLILLLSSTGLRRGAVPLIRRKHLKFIPEFKLYQITTYPKSREKYVTFTTPEAAKEINAYFAYREQCGEVLNDDSPLIREQFHSGDKDRAARPTPTSNSALKMLLVRTVRIAGVKTAHQSHDDGRQTQRTEIMLSHGLRKYFDTALANARLHPVKLAALMGHKEGLQRSYLRASEAELLEDYVKAVNRLTINEENELRLQVDKLQSEKDALIEMLQSKVAAIEKWQQDKEALEEKERELQTAAPVAVAKRKQQGRQQK